MSRHRGETIVQSLQKYLDNPGTYESIIRWYDETQSKFVIVDEDRFFKELYCGKRDSFRRSLQGYSIGHYQLQYWSDKKNPGVPLDLANRSIKSSKKRPDAAGEPSNKSIKKSHRRLDGDPAHDTTSSLPDDQAPSSQSRRRRHNTDINTLSSSSGPRHLTRPISRSSHMPTAQMLSTTHQIIHPHMRYRYNENDKGLDQSHSMEWTHSSSSYDDTSSSYYDSSNSSCALPFIQLKEYNSYFNTNMNLMTSSDNNNNNNNSNNDNTNHSIDNRNTMRFESNDHNSIAPATETTTEITMETTTEATMETTTEATATGTSVDYTHNYTDNAPNYNSLSNNNNNDNQLYNNNKNQLYNNNDNDDSNTYINYTNQYNITTINETNYNNTTNNNCTASFNTTTTSIFDNNNNTIYSHNNDNDTIYGNNTTTTNNYNQGTTNNYNQGTTNNYNSNNYNNYTNGTKNSCTNDANNFNNGTNNNYNNSIHNYNNTLPFSPPTTTLPLSPPTTATTTHNLNNNDNYHVLDQPLRQNYTSTVESPPWLLTSSSGFMPPPPLSLLSQQSSQSPHEHHPRKLFDSRPTLFFANEAGDDIMHDSAQNNIRGVSVLHTPLMTATPHNNTNTTTSTNSNNNNNDNNNTELLRDLSTFSRLSLSEETKPHEWADSDYLRHDNHHQNHLQIDNSPLHDNSLDTLHHIATLECISRSGSFS